MYKKILATTIKVNILSCIVNELCFLLVQDNYTESLTSRKRPYQKRGNKLIMQYTVEHAQIGEVLLNFCRPDLGL